MPPGERKIAVPRAVSIIIADQNRPQANWHFASRRPVTPPALVTGGPYIRPVPLATHSPQSTHPMAKSRRPISTKKPKKRTAGGVATSQVTVSAHISGNADVFPEVLALHVADGARIADVTWGKGVFWKNVAADRYELLATDLQTGVDCRQLPYDDASLDCVVLDPPYMEGLFRRAGSQLAGGGTHAAFRGSYSNSKRTVGGPKYHEAVLDLYYRAGAEAHRVLKPNGVFDRQMPGRSQRQPPAAHARRADQPLRGERLLHQRPVRGGTDEPARGEPAEEAGPRPQEPLVLSRFREDARGQAARVDAILSASLRHLLAITIGHPIGPFARAK